jgi:hypothetical protein
LRIAGVFGIEAQVIMLGIGLAALAIASLSEADDVKSEIPETESEGS